MDVPRWPQVYVKPWMGHTRHLVVVKVTCAHTLYLFLSNLLQFEAEVVTALIPTPPSVHGAGMKWKEIPGHCIRDLIPSRDINFPVMCVPLKV